jgi:hypothetical protein
VGTRRLSSKLILRQYPNCRLQRHGLVGDVSVKLAAFGAFIAMRYEYAGMH